MASDTLAYSKLIAIFRDISARNKNLNDFGFGQTSEVGASRPMLFPFLWVEPSQTRSVRVEGGYLTDIISFNFYLMDKIKQGESNWEDILSDTKYTLDTIITEITQHRYYRELDISLANDIVMQPFIEQFDDNTNGWVAGIDFKMPVRYTVCNSPIEPITGYTVSLNSNIAEYRLVGSQGFQGIQGWQGSGGQGFQGGSGLQGFQGWQGSGVQGSIGSTGIQGFQGRQGFQGWQGSQGFQGNQGFQGATGRQGFQGFQGFQGRQGFQGFQGWQGAGDQGYQGPTGSPIDDGIEDYRYYRQYGGKSMLLVDVIDFQSDNKILIGGIFSSFDSISTSMFIRLHPDGSPDSIFITNLGSNFNDKVYTIDYESSNGSIFIGGDFTSFNGSGVGYLSKIDTNGNVDSTFASNIGSGCDASVFKVFLQSDNKLLVGGNYISFNGDSTYQYLIRLDDSGIIDTDFTNTLKSSGDNKGIDNYVLDIKQQTDGNLIIVGSFTSLNGDVRKSLIRLLPTGAEDTTFYSNLVSTGDNSGFDNQINSISIRDDGKILVGGSFTMLNGNTRNGLVLLNSDGTEDAGFYSNLGSGFTNPTEAVYSVYCQKDYRMLVGGEFTDFNGNTRNRLVRLNSDGTEDVNFYNNIGTGYNSAIYEIAFNDGKLLIGGAFSVFNDLSRNCVNRLYDFTVLEGSIGFQGIQGPTGYQGIAGVASMIPTSFATFSQSDLLSKVIDVYVPLTYNSGVGVSQSITTETTAKIHCQFNFSIPAYSGALTDIAFVRIRRENGSGSPEYSYENVYFLQNSLVSIGGIVDFDTEILPPDTYNFIPEFFTSNNATYPTLADSLSDIYVFQSSIWLISMQGSVGPTGSAGANGTQGFQGWQGSAGSGTGITGGTANYIVKYTGMTSMGISTISDNGMTVSISNGMTINGITYSYSAPLQVTSYVSGPAGFNTGILVRGAAPSIVFEDTSSNDAMIGVENGDMFFYTGAAATNTMFQIRPGQLNTIFSMNTIWASDNTYDIGALGTSRPRNINVGSTLSCGLINFASTAGTNDIVKYTGLKNANNGIVFTPYHGVQIKRNTAVYSEPLLDIVSNDSTTTGVDLVNVRNSGNTWFKIGPDGIINSQIVTAIGKSTGGGSTQSIIIGHNGTNASSGDGIATIKFLSQFSNTPFTMGAEGNGYNFIIRQLNGGQGTFQFNFGTISSTLYTMDLQYITDHYEQIFAGKWLTSVSGSGVAGNYYGFKNTITPNSTSALFDTFRIERQFTQGFYPMSNDPIISIFNGDSTGTTGIHNRYVARFNRLGYLGIGTTNIYATQTTIQAALTIDQGSKVGTKTAGGTVSLTVSTTGTSSSAVILGNTNGEIGIGLILGSVITANGVSRTITNISNSSQFTLDSTVNWDNSGLGYTYSYINPYLSLQDGTTKYFVVGGTGSVTIGSLTGSGTRNLVVNSLGLVSATANSISGGTTSFVTKYTGSNTIGPGLLYDNGTNLAYGTSSGLSSRRFSLYGGSNGCNMFLRGSAGAFVNQSFLQMEGNNYDTDFLGLFFIFRGTDYSGNYTGIDTTISNNGLGILQFGGVNSIIQTVGATNSLQFFPSGKLRMSMGLTGVYIQGTMSSSILASSSTQNVVANANGDLVLGNGSLTQVNVLSLTQSGSISYVTGYTASSDIGVIVGCNVNITAISAGTLAVQIAYTDETNTSSTYTFLTGLSSTGHSNPAPVLINMKSGTGAIISTTMTGVSISYNIRAYIQTI